MATMDGRLFSLYGHEEILKKIFSETPEVISLECSMGENCSLNFDPSKNMAAVGGGGEEIFFALYGHEKILKKIFSETAGQNLE